MPTIPNSKRRFINVNFTMSYEEYDKGSTMPEYHLHNDYEIYVLQQGHRIVTTGTAPSANSDAAPLHTIEVSTEPGDAALFCREHPHKSRGTSAYAGICIHFSERFLKKYFTETSIAKFMELFALPKIHLSSKSVAELKSMTDTFIAEEETNFLKLAKIFEMLYAAAALPQAPVSISAPTTKKAQLFTYINENYAYIHNLARLADSFGISESYLYQIFQNEYQMSPKTYINKLRIQNICSRLKYSDATLKSISEDFGFESYEHFCRLFKKEMGCSPRQYRDTLLQNASNAPIPQQTPHAYD